MSPKKARPGRVKVTVRLDESTINQLKHKAIDYGLSASDIIEALVEQWMKGSVKLDPRDYFDKPSD